MEDREVEEVAAVIAHALGSRYEVSPREREDERRRDQQDAHVDPWGYPDPPLEPDEG